MREGASPGSRDRTEAWGRSSSRALHSWSSRSALACFLARQIDIWQARLLNIYADVGRRCLHVYVYVAPHRIGPGRTGMALASLHDWHCLSWVAYSLYIPSSFLHSAVTLCWLSLSYISTCLLYQARLWLTWQLRGEQA